MGGEQFEQGLIRFWEWITTGGVLVFLILIVMMVSLSFLKRGVQRLQKILEGAFPDPAQVKRANTLTHVIGDTLRVVIVLVGTLMALAQLGINLAPLLMAAGVGGIAIGFGAQSIVKDVITGFFILLENQIRVGDVVTVADITALVEEVRLRTTRLRDLSGRYHIIPNGMIDKVSNWTRGFSFAVFDMGIAYREDADEVMAVIKNLGAELKEDPVFAPDILEPLEMLGVDQFADSAVVIKFRIKTIPGRQWAITREMNRRMKQAFDTKGIEIPFPHRTIYWGALKDGSAPPVYVAEKAKAS